ncbi:serine hydrolase [Paludisphaera soli]|uniref:serine hydrolase n=1 Tax=Paludisphaera soli TaxID=2712865 RepID=UPI0013EB425F|nr:serine hydrolase [Paludisphaera soli]
MIRLGLPAFLIALSLADGSGASVADDRVFPGVEWEHASPEDRGLDGPTLDRLAEALGGRGCVVRDGYVVKAWGDQTLRTDWYSSVKPLLSTLLFFAVHEGKVAGVDAPIRDFGWDLKPKDQAMTFRHLADMTSGYARPEPPGVAWAYNDFAIQLYQETLFDRVFRAEAEEVVGHPDRLGPLRFQDGLKFNAKRRLKASVRDFARIAWFWANRGRWGDRQLLPRRDFDDWMRPDVPAGLPRTAKAETDDYLGVGSFGGGSDHFTASGPGIYGFNWWFNAPLADPARRTWPDAPPETVMSLGFGGNCTAILPDLRLVLVSAEGDWGEIQPGDPGSKMNLRLKRLAGSVRDDAPMP